LTASAGTSLGPLPLAIGDSARSTSLSRFLLLTRFLSVKPLVSDVAASALRLDCSSASTKYNTTTTIAACISQSSSIPFNPLKCKKEQDLQQIVTPIYSYTDPRRGAPARTERRASPGRTTRTHASALFFTIPRGVQDEVRSRRKYLNETEV
jgi:hypothetical protein